MTSRLIRPFGNPTVQDDQKLSELKSRKNVVWIDSTGASQIHLLTNFLELYNSPSKNSTTFIISNSSSTAYLEILIDLHETLHPESQKPVIITNEQTSKQRRKLYENHNLIFITPRILIVDLLSNNAKNAQKSEFHIIPYENITGVVVLHAEKITEKSQIPYIIRLIKQNAILCKFIKAISTDPIQIFNYGLTDMLQELCLDSAQVYEYDFPNPKLQRITKIRKVIKSQDELKIRRLISEIFKKMWFKFKKLTSKEIKGINMSQDELNACIIPTSNKNYVNATSINGVKPIQKELKQLSTLYRQVRQRSPAAFFAEILRFLPPLTDPKGVPEKNCDWIHGSESSELIVSSRKRVFDEVPDLWVKLGDVLEELTRNSSNFENTEIDENSDHQNCLVLCAGPIQQSELSDLLKLTIPSLKKFLRFKHLNENDDIYEQSNLKIPLDTQLVDIFDPTAEIEPYIILTKIMPKIIILPVFKLNWYRAVQEFHTRNPGQIERFYIFEDIDVANNLGVSVQLEREAKAVGKLKRERDMYFPRQDIIGNIGKTVRSKANPWDMLNHVVSMDAKTGSQGFLNLSVAVMTSVLYVV